MAVVPRKRGTRMEAVVLLVLAMLVKVVGQEEGRGGERQRLLRFGESGSDCVSRPAQRCRRACDVCVKRWRWWCSV